MNHTARKTDRNPKSNLGTKLATLAGVGAAVGVLAPDAAAAIINATSTIPSGGRPPATTGSAPWDIDGIGGAEFELENFKTGGQDRAYLAGISANVGGIFLQTNPSFYNAAFFNNLAKNATIGPSATVPSAVWGQPHVFLTFGGVLPNQTYSYMKGWTVGQPGYFGFRFSPSANGVDWLYGWGTMTIDLAAPEGTGYQITSAYYDDILNEPILAGDTGVIPEPSSIALIALGAAGIAGWRRRRAA